MSSSAQTKQFIQTIAPIIEEEAKQRGYKICSAIVAQAVIESASGTSLLSMKYHNYFGMKCGSAWKGPSVNLATKEEYNSQLVSIRDNFRCYPDMIAGVKGYFDFISTSRYANLKNAATAQEYLELIKRDGYATSSSYVNTCMSCVGRHDLERYDWEHVEENPYKLNKKYIRMGDRGESVKWLQWQLNQHGANLQVDGIFGKQTKLAVLLFQKDHELVQDGIVGPKTMAALRQ